MLKEYIVLGEGVKMLDDGLTKEDHEKEAALKEKMKMFVDGRMYLGRCKECGHYICEGEKHFYLTNKDGLGNMHVDVCCAYH